MTRTHFFVVSAVTLLAAACSSSNGGSASTAAVTATGTAGGLSFSAPNALVVAEAIVSDGTYAIPESGFAHLDILIQDGAVACATSPKSVRGLEISLLSPDGQSPLAAGTYDLDSTSDAGDTSVAGVDGYDSTCLPTGTADSATAGTVTINSISQTSIDASFSIAFADGTFIGTLNVPICAGAASTCQ